MKKLFYLLTILFLLSGGAFTYAQTTPPTGQQSQFCSGGSCTYVPLEPLPGLPNCFGAVSQNCINPTSFGGLVGSAFKLFLGVGAVVAVIMLVLGGMTYMFSDVVGNKTKAISRIRNAMWAILILASSYLILNTINPELVQFKLNINPLPGGTTNPGGTANPTPANQTMCDPTDCYSRHGHCTTATNPPSCIVP